MPSFQLAKFHLKELINDVTCLTVSSVNIVLLEIRSEKKDL